MMGSEDAARRQRGLYDWLSRHVLESRLARKLEGERSSERRAALVGGKR
jgi:hypothetical protein